MSGRLELPRYLEPEPGETTGMARARRKINRELREQWIRDAAATCSRCGYARINVRHELDPATAPEGPDYYADMLGELHEFEPA